LFVLREFENPERMFHSVWHSFGIRYVGSINYIYDCHVERSETSLTSSLWNARAN
jgi:hypothetical protein